MALPHALVERIKAGRVALFLGAGALFGATLPSNKAIPLGSGLRDLLCKRFLNNEYSDDSLAFVSEMAISAYSLQEVQSYIAEYFNGIVPAPFHLEIPKFKWNAIFTTNYDLFNEMALDELGFPYNNGFSGGFVAATLVPIFNSIEAVFERRRNEKF